MLLVGYCLGVRSERRLQYTYEGANKSSAMIAMRFILFAHRGNCYVRITEPSPFFGFEEANTKDLAPCGEGLVCGDQQRSPFVSRADEFEQRGTRQGYQPGDIGQSIRIGISRDANRLLRFYLRGSAFVSGPKLLKE